MMMNKQRQPNNDLMVYDGLDGSGWRGTLYKIDAFMVASKSSVSVQRPVVTSFSRKCTRPEFVTSVPIEESDFGQSKIVSFSELAYLDEAEHSEPSSEKMAPPNKSTESDDDDDDMGALIYMKSQLTKVEAAAQLPQEQEVVEKESK